MNPSIECLYLSEEEAGQAGAYTVTECMQTMEEVLRLVAAGDYIMGGPGGNQHGMKLYFPKESRFAGMPLAGADKRFMALAAYVGGRFGVCGIKWYGSNPANREKGLPRANHMIVLNDAVSGLPLCILAGNGVSAVRTGAMAGLGAKYLSQPKGQSLALLGIGAIGKVSGEAILSACPDVRLVKLFNRTEEKARELAVEFEQKFNVTVQVCHDIRQAVEGSDIVNIALSGQELPKIKYKWIQDGALVIAASDCMMEKKCYSSMKIVADNWKMFVEYAKEREQWPGDEKIREDMIRRVVRMVEKGKLKKKNIVELGTVIEGGSGGRKSRKEKILLILGGMGVEDVAWGYVVYKNAWQQKLGTKLPFM